MGTRDNAKSKAAVDLAGSEVVLYTVLNLLNYLDRYLLAAVLPLIAIDYHLTQTQSGLLATAFVVGYICFSPIFGYLGDRVARPLLIAMSVVIWSCATLAGGFELGFTIFVISRLLVGIGEAGYATLVPGYFKDRCANPERLPKLLALFFSAIPVGAALGYVLGGIIASIYSWKHAFVICAVPGILLAALIFGGPEIRKSDNVHKIGFLEGVKNILGTRLVCFAIGGYVLNAFALNGIATFVTGFGLNIGFKLDQITQAFGIILVAAGIIGTHFGTKLSEFYARSRELQTARLRFIGWCSCLSAPIVALTFSTENQWIFLVGAFIAEVVVFAVVAPVNAVIVESAPSGTTSLTQGVAILALNLFGSALAPPLIGFVADSYSLAAGLQLAAIGLLLSGFIWLWGGKART